MDRGSRLIALANGVSDSRQPAPAALSRTAAAAILRCVEPVIDIAALLQRPRATLEAWDGLGVGSRRYHYEGFDFDEKDLAGSERRFAELRPIVARQLACDPLPHRAAAQAMQLPVVRGAWYDACDALNSSSWALLRLARSLDRLNEADVAAAGLWLLHFSVRQPRRRSR